LNSVVVSSTQNICNITQNYTVFYARRPRYKHVNDDYDNDGGGGDDDDKDGDDYTDRCYFSVFKYQNECPQTEST